MANSSVTLKDGAGTNYSVDTETQTGGDHRQVLVIGDPAAATEAAVDSGGLQVSTQGRPITAVTGTITAAASTVTATVTAAGNATITVNGTYAGVSYAFLASDDAGTTFYPVQVVREDNGQVMLADTPGTNGKVSYLVDIPGWNQVRVAASAWTSGTANVRISPGGGPFVPVVSVGNTGGSSSTPSSVTSTATVNTTLLAANPNRRGAAVFNESTSVLFLLLSSVTAEAAGVYTAQLPPSGYYEVPFGYTGRVAGHWTTAQGFARISEITP